MGGTGTGRRSRAAVSNGRGRTGVARGARHDGAALHPGHAIATVSATVTMAWMLLHTVGDASNQESGMHRSTLVTLALTLGSVPALAQLLPTMPVNPGVTATPTHAPAGGTSSGAAAANMAPRDRIHRGPGAAGGPPAPPRLRARVRRSRWHPMPATPPGYHCWISARLEC